MRLSCPSTEEELRESWLEEVFIAVSVASMLEEDPERLRLEV